MEVPFESRVDPQFFLLFAIPPLLWVVRWRGQRGRGFPVEVNAARAAGLRCSLCCKGRMLRFSRHVIHSMESKV